jgi:hypothetical protein
MILRIAAQGDPPPLTASQRVSIGLIAERGSLLVRTCSELGSGPDLALAKARIAQSVILAVKHVLASSTGRADG